MKTLVRMRVHVLQHVPFEGLGSIQAWLTRRGAQVTASRFFESDALPAVSSCDLVIALGGPMSVNDEAKLPWLAREKQFLADAIRSGKRVLGICLGAQLMASALGARVYAAPEKEIGWFPVFGEGSPGPAFRFPECFRAFHWHGETFDLPRGARLLAGSRACRHQAFQVGARAVGLQFHLETTPAAVDALVAHCGHELVPQRFVQTEQQLRAAPSGDYSTLNALMEEVLDYLARPGS